MRAARHGVGRGVGTKLSGWTRRRADTQFCQPSARPPRRSLPRLSPETTPTPHPLPIRSRPAQPPPTACSRGTAPRRSPHRHARDADNDQHRRAEVAGSIQMSKPGSIGVSAEGGIQTWCSGSGRADLGGIRRPISQGTSTRSGIDVLRVLLSTSGVRRLHSRRKTGGERILGVPTRCA